VLLHGWVFDAVSSKPISYCNIGIPALGVGTVSDMDGLFSMTLPTDDTGQVLRFSVVGYSAFESRIVQLLKDSVLAIGLYPKAFILPSVKIRGSNFVERKFGVHSNLPHIHFTDGSVKQHDIFEIAQLIRLGPSTAHVKKISLKVAESRKDSTTIRVNFYGYAGGRPTDQILNQPIVIRTSVIKGSMDVDLTPYHIYLKGDVVAALEFLPPKGKVPPIYYEVKIGGRSKSFVRTSSQGLWAVPPHHYRMLVTAMVPSTTKGDEEEEKETKPRFEQYSKSVADSFSIFIKLPPNYSNTASKPFPVLYLLDANAYFDLVADAMDEGKIPRAILVGVGYKDVITMDTLRGRDYTYPKSSSRADDNSGGADRFLKYLCQELIPGIDAEYKTDTSKRVLAGHSLGGYFVLYALWQSILQGRQPFAGYLAASPSLDWANRYLVNKLVAQGDGKIVKDSKLFMSFGGREDAEEEAKGTPGMDNYKKTEDILSRPDFKPIKLTSKVYPDFGHMETALPSFIDGL
jgi:predicted alpha/beta superfamily hydrolase